MKLREFTRRRALITSRHHGIGKRYRKEMAHLIRDAGAVPVVIARKIAGYRLKCGKIVCVKERFRTELAALHTMKMIHDTNHNQHRVPVRAYYCSYCFGWHLTSQERNAA